MKSFRPCEAAGGMRGCLKGIPSKGLGSSVDALGWPGGQGVGTPGASGVQLASSKAKLVGGVPRFQVQWAVASYPL